MILRIGWGPRATRFIENGSGWWALRAGGAAAELVFNADGVSVSEYVEFWWWLEGMGARNRECT